MNEKVGIKKNRKSAERVRLFWPKIEDKDVFNAQIFVNETVR